MRIILICSLLILLSACGPRKIITTHRVEHTSPARYNKILVVTVLPDTEIELRKTIETEVVSVLSGYGYDATSAISTFGPKGLVAASEEATYLKLCSSGIDAVMTLSLVPIEKETHYRGVGQYIRTNNYYYNRIWDYKKMQADMIPGSPEDEYYWESILFDLRTLQSTCILRTQIFTGYNQPKINNDLARLVTKKMVKEKVIRKKNNNLKAF
jgi:hypothetical protein